MKYTEETLARGVAIAVLVVSLAMFVPLTRAVGALVHGLPILRALWLAPLLILGTGAALMYVLSRRQVALQLYLTAFALWLLTAGYVLVTAFRA
jgi:hypothetical protein